MGTPQIIYLILISLNLLISANKHGKPKKGNKSFWESVFGLIIILPLLYWGGFFS